MTREILNKLIEYIKSNKGKSFGSIIGFIIAILILSIGFFKTLLIILCTWVGYFLGRKCDNKESMKDLIDKIFP